MDIKYSSMSVEDTLNLAKNIEANKFDGMVICLNGELGSGKTVFVKGFAKALGINETITSPTFTIIKEYEFGNNTLSHMDVYRIEGDPTSLGLEDYFNGTGICIIEWAHLIEKYLPNERLDINFEQVDENTRTLIFKPYGEKYEDLVDKIL